MLTLPITLWLESFSRSSSSPCPSCNCSTCCNSPALIKSSSLGISCSPVRSITIWSQEQAKASDQLLVSAQPHTVSSKALAKPFNWSSTHTQLPKATTSTILSISITTNIRPLGSLQTPYTQESTPPCASSSPMALPFLWADTTLQNRPTSASESEHTARVLSNTAKVQQLQTMLNFSRSSISAKALLPFTRQSTNTAPLKTLSTPARCLQTLWEKEHLASALILPSKRLSTSIAFSCLTATRPSLSVRLLRWFKRLSVPPGIRLEKSPNRSIAHLPTTSYECARVAP